MALRHAPRDALRVVRRHVRKTVSAAVFGADTPIHHHHQETLAQIEIQNAPVLVKDYNLTPSEIFFDSRYPCFNPGLLRIDSGYLVVARSTNIVTINDANYLYQKPLNSEEYHLTENFLIRLNDDLRIVERCKLDFDDRSLRLMPHGIEDIRLFSRAGRIYGVGAVLNKPRYGVDQVAQAIFELVDGRGVDLTIVDSPFGSLREKNWSPLARADGDFLFVLSTTPVTVAICDDHGVRLDGRFNTRQPALGVRGSTNYIPWGSGWLALVHNPPVSINGKVHYVHKFCLLDSDLNLREHSPAFFIQRKGIEFACGLAVDGDDLILSYGVSDRSAWVCRMPKKIVRQFLGESLGEFA